MEERSLLPVYVTRSQKIERVKQMYMEGKNVKEIAKEVHLSFTDVKKATNEAAEAIEKTQRESLMDRQSFSRKRLSGDSQAFALFSKSKTPVEVAIKLNLNAQEVERMYLDYWQLRRLHKLSQLYSKHRGELLLAFRLLELVREHTIKEGEILNLLKYSKELPHLEDTVEEQHQEIYDLKRIKSELEKEICPLLERVHQLKNYELEMTMLKVERNDKDLSDLKHEYEHQVSKANERAALLQKVSKAMQDGTFRLTT